jgi:hypothetical protein
MQESSVFNVEKDGTRAYRIPVRFNGFKGDNWDTSKARVLCSEQALNGTVHNA